MSSINLGNQTVVFDYKQPLQGHEFNQLLRGIIKPGFYQSEYAYNAGNSIIIPPFRACIPVSTDKVVMIKTASNVTFTAVSPTQYLVMNFTWYDVAQNWIDFELKDLADIATTDIVICKINYSGANVSSIDTTVRTEGLFDSSYNMNLDTVMHILDTTESTSSITGALIVDGGVGIAGDLFVGGNVDVTGTMTIDDDLTVTSGDVNITSGDLNVSSGDAYIYGDTICSGAIHIYDVTESTSVSAGALIVDGGVGIAKNLNVNGNVDVNGVIKKSNLGIRGFITIGITDFSTNSAIRIKIFEMGDWNMAVTTNIEITHNLTWTKIINVHAIIQGDGGSVRYFLQDGNKGSIDINSTKIILWRLTDGYFDNPGFDATSFNRGWVFVEYID
jgi:hypothetical protein